MQLQRSHLVLNGQHVSIKKLSRSLYTEFQGFWPCDFPGFGEKMGLTETCWEMRSRRSQSHW